MRNFPKHKYPFSGIISIQILLCLTAAVLIFSSCGTDSTKNGTSTEGIPGDETLVASSPLLKLLPSDQTGINFKNTIDESFEMNITTHINTSNGGGVAILDINNDNLQDVYFISSSGKNKLYLNEGGMKFKDISDSSGVVSDEGFEVAVTAVDINNDGLMDLYVCRAGPIVEEVRRNKLFINNGDLTFSEQAAAYGLDDKSASMGANFFDFDNDGDLDLYLLNYPVDFSFSSRINVRPTPDGKNVEPILDPLNPFDSDRLYRNDGIPQADGTGGFTDISESAGIWNFGYGLSVSIEDFNHDGWMDVYVANDFIQPDLLYINQRNGTFKDQLGNYFRHTTQHSMGTDLSDFDNDGLFDLFAVDMLSETQYRKKTLMSTNSQNKYTTLIRNNYFEPVVRNVLQHNNGNGTFSDIGCMANVYQTDWSWSGLMADLDNDGWKDLLITNGYQREVTDVDFINFTFAEIKAKGSIKNQFENVNDFLNLIPQYKLRDYVYRNKGDLTFEDVSGVWMTNPPTWSNGAATADLDNDGDLDYLVNNINDEAFVYENLASEKKDHHYLQVKCIGSASNPFAIGASVRIFYGNEQQYAMLTPTKGIFSSVDYIIHFGLGATTTIDKVEIKWPDGKMQYLTNIPTNQRLQLNYAEAKFISETKNPNYPTLFKEVTNSSNLHFRHQENDYSDFDNFFMLPWALSDLGPQLATADINSDGLTDVFIGNSFGKPGGVYIQDKNGSFSQISQEQWDQDSIYEDHGALFFDADMDNDLDLLVISGGYESVSPLAWQSRLYINENGEKLIHAKGAIPLLADVCMEAVAFDYDMDGDLDLFIGGRVVPGKYPSTPHSYILRNDRNKFTDVTNEVCPDFANVGMVTDLQLGNVDDDPAAELVVVGEWMPITIFDFNNGQMVKSDLSVNGLNESNGFWNRIILNDLDGDGDLDLVTGNLGLNSQYRASSDNPIKCYVGDYDQNGSLDPIITYYENGKSYPLVQKEVLIKQIPMMKKRYLYSKTYAQATIEDILNSKQLESSMILKSFVLESGWWENNKGKFKFHAFPSQAQTSVTNGLVISDMDNDGLTDILLVGNKYRMEVETGRLDAGNGTFLKGNGKGQFQWVGNQKTGIWASHDARDAAILFGSNGKFRIIVANNNDLAQVFESN